MPCAPAGKLPGSGKAKAHEAGKFVCHACCKPHLRNTSLAWRPSLREPLEALHEAGPRWLAAVFLLRALSSATFNEASHKVNLQTTRMKKMASRRAKHSALRCMVQRMRMHSQSIPFRPLWDLQATFAKTSCLAVASARKVHHTFHFATTPLADSMPFLARGGFLAYLAHLLNRSLCSRMWRSGPTQRTTWLARVSGSLARSMAASACLRALAKHAPTHAQQHTLA